MPLNIPSDVPADLYRSFLVTYGVSALGRMAVECYKQIAILQAAWYDVPTAAFTVLEHGFIQYVLLSFAAAEVLNMVLGALYKDRVRRQANAERDKAWEGWLRRKAESEAKGEPFNEPSPSEQMANAKS